MKVHDCCCQWRFIIGKRRVYGPIYAIGLAGHFTGPTGCHTQGRMITRMQFDIEYADCSACFDGAHKHDRSA